MIAGGLWGAQGAAGSGGVMELGPYGEQQGAWQECKGLIPK